jgi:hypothetical protein
MVDSDAGKLDSRHVQAASGGVGRSNGPSTDGSLVNLPRPVETKWTATVACTSAQSSGTSGSPSSQRLGKGDCHLGEVQIVPVTDLSADVHALEDADPERALHFLTMTQAVDDLLVVTDFEFVYLLVSSSPTPLRESMRIWGVFRDDPKMGGGGSLRDYFHISTSPSPREDSGLS